MFTDNKDWKKDVLKKIESSFNNEIFVYFKYVFFKLFDLRAIDYYEVENPVVKVLLPKMKHKSEEKY